MKSDETTKTEVPYHSRFGTIKIPLCPKAVSAVHRPKLCHLLTTMVVYEGDFKIVIIAIMS